MERRQTNSRNDVADARAAGEITEHVSARGARRTPRRRAWLRGV